MTKLELEDWAMNVFWPSYKKLCATPFPTKWRGGARGEAVAKVLALNPSEELRQRIISSVHAQTIHRKKLYDICGSAQRYEDKVKYNKFYTNRDGKTWIFNKGWNDEIPSLMEKQIEEREGKKDIPKCACGDIAVKGQSCDQCFHRKLDKLSISSPLPYWHKHLQESYKRVPPRKEGETYHEWAKRVFNFG